MDAAIATLPALTAAPATPGGAPGASQGDAPESASGRAFRALLGQHANAAAKARGEGRTDTRTDARKDARTPGPTDADAPTDAVAEEPATSEAGTDAPSAPPEASTDPALAHLLQPAAAPTAAAGAGPAGVAAQALAAAQTTAQGAAPSDASNGTPKLRTEAPAGRGLKRGDTAALGDTPALPGADKKLPAAPLPAEGPGFAARFAEARAAPEASPQRAEPPFSAALAPAGGLPGAAQARFEVPTPPPSMATLQAPPESVDFPGQFGLQIATFARDGVEHAELHLNPAEMGPVSVQIALDGTQARVELRADVAATRDALQHSLPALAAALREAGLTLAGGSVSSQAGGQGGSDGQGGRGTDRDASGGPGSGEATALAPLPAPVRRTVRLGGVDLYA